MTRNKILASLLIAGVAVLSLLFVRFTGPKASNQSEPGDQRTPPPSAEPDREQTSRPPAEQPRALPAEPPRRVEPERDQLRRTLQHRFGRRSAEQEGADEGELESPAGAPEQAVLPPASWSSLPEEYVRGILQEQLIPVAESCYEDVAPKGTNGALTLSVAVIGDAEIGGVIDRIDINGAETSIEGELNECVRQAAYDLAFDPPEEGQGVQEFEFTIEFSEDEDPS